MPGLTIESLRAISTQANRELENSLRKLEHAQRYHRSTLQKANTAREAYEQACETVDARRDRAFFADADALD